MFALLIMFIIFFWGNMLMTTEAFVLGPRNFMTGDRFRSVTRTRLNMAFEWQPVKTGVEDKMEKTVESLTQVYSSLRLNGGAVASIIEKTMVPINAPKPTVSAISSIASVRVNSPTTIVVEPFDTSHVKVIESSIMAIGMGLAVSSTSLKVITVTIPPLTEDRRKEMVKKAKTYCEDHKISLRNIRRDAVERVKKEFAAKQVDKDTSKFYQEELQKVTDKYSLKLDNLHKQKEKALLSLQ